ncbi:MAG: ATP-dependent helicase/nuclease subunit A [Gammaproteobacteria bacterium]|jgi:ATP-dependent helicase/nuclease subunit A
MSRPADWQAREQALDTNTSFIVQAPAGSGKTELLTQRYLALLAKVESPENILAITFTRKAANEMRNRIVGAIEKSRDSAEPTAEHELKTWQLGRAVLERDFEQEWMLLDSPGRLRISTIDSLCHSITRQMPLLAQLGGGIAVADDCNALYQQAARDTIDQGLTGRFADATHLVLDYLGNRVDRLETLLSSMLAGRDRWLNDLGSLQYAAADVGIEAMETVLSDLVCTELAHAQSVVGESLITEIIPLMQYAANHVPDKLSHWAEWQNIAGPLGSQAADLPHWNLLAEALLTGGGTIRSAKGITKALGFIAKSPETEQFKELVGNLAGDEALQAALNTVQTLPHPEFSDEESNVIDALIKLLTHAVAQLKLVFGSRAQLDHSEVMLRALDALGDEDQPTDLALALDYKIQHILADEVQDTSRSQFRLFEKLVQGWQPDEGRTFFAVGDPMQSIYLFRQAEVGLYLQAWDTGIGDIPLTQLSLTVNFRSQGGLVEWFNQSFPAVFPPQNDAAHGAVTYASADAWHESQPAPVSINPILGTKQQEAAKVVELIQNAQQQRPGKSIAILVRTRPVLDEIVPALVEAGIAFKAVDIEKLSAQPVVSDLQALTRALIHPADRVAWLAVLRAPWCGVGLSALLDIAGRRSDYPIWPQLIANQDPLVQRILPVLQAAIAQRGRLPVRQLVEATWRRLGGPGCCTSALELKAAELFFEQLEKLEAEQGSTGELIDFQRLEDSIDKLYSPPDTSSENSVQLMTIHKSKGLQFDTVIVPGLGRKPANDDEPPLRWMEHQTSTGESHVVIAPLKRDGGETSKLNRLISKHHIAKQHNEVARLFYVAATRAETQLHFTSTLAVLKSGKLAARPAGSLLDAFWPIAELSFAEALQAYSAPADEDLANRPTSNSYSRLPLSWQAEVLEEGIQMPEAPSQPTDEQPIDYDWASPAARHVGSLIHRLLEQAANDHLNGWDEPRLKTLQPSLELALQSQGVSKADLGWAAGSVVKALRQTLNHPQGRWLLESHPEARSEMPISGVLNGEVINAIIDRTFVDDKGTRWIVDYKASRHSGGDLKGFYNSEAERYTPQLKKYLQLFSQRESRPVKLALYFPLMQHLLELN